MPATKVASYRQDVAACIAWLRDTLKKLPTCLNSQIDSLLPFGPEHLHKIDS